MKIFYDHLINLEELIVELDGHEIAVEEREELIGLMDQTMHHQILEAILDHLPKEHHEDFLSRFHQAPHSPDLLVFIKERVTVDIESVIKDRAGKAKKEILREIKKSKTKRA